MSKPKPSGARVLVPTGEFEEGKPAAQNFLDAMKSLLRSKKETDQKGKSKRN